jgi:hypothetical protein
MRQLCFYYAFFTRERSKMADMMHEILNPVPVHNLSLPEEIPVMRGENPF